MKKLYEVKTVCYRFESKAEMNTVGKPMIADGWCINNVIVNERLNSGDKSYEVEFIMREV